MVADAWQVPVCDLSLLKRTNLLHLGFNACSGLTDRCIQIVVRRYHAGNIECEEITTAGVLALGHGCGQLQSIDLGGCHNVTDTGISALGRGCVNCRALILKAVVR